MNYQVTNNIYRIKNYEEELKLANEFVKERVVENFVIQSPEDKKIVYKKRTEINAQIKNLDEFKKLVNSAALYDFNTQAKAIIDTLQEGANTLTTQLKTYDTEILAKPDKLKKITLTIKGYDPVKIKKVQEYAQSIGNLEIEVK